MWRIEQITPGLFDIVAGGFLGPNRTALVLFIPKKEVLSGTSHVKVRAAKLCHMLVCVFCLCFSSVGGVLRMVRALEPSGPGFDSCFASDIQGVREMDVSTPRFRIFIS